MPDDILHQPNDKLVKATFSDLENARAFFKGHLAENLSSHVEWNTLRLESGTFIDQQLAGTESDLLYSVNLSGSKLFLYLLFEHQSTEDPILAFRILSYMVRIWEKHLRSNPQFNKLSPILPIVLAQDIKPWKLSRQFQDIVAKPDGIAEKIQKCTPDFKFSLIELSRIPFDKILGTPAGILTLRALKAEKLGELLGTAVWDELLLVELSAEAFERLMRYIFNADIDKPAFSAKLEKITHQSLNQKAMTLAEQFRQEGRQEGQQEGRQEGIVISKQQDIIEALEIRFDYLPEGMKEEIQSIREMAKLSLLHRAAIRCSNIESFAGNL